MTDVEIKIEDEDFSEELSDEALDRERVELLACAHGACMCFSKG